MSVFSKPQGARGANGDENKTPDLTLRFNVKGFCGFCNSPDFVLCRCSEEEAEPEQQQCLESRVNRWGRSMLKAITTLPFQA